MPRDDADVSLTMFMEDEGDGVVVSGHTRRCFLRRTGKVLCQQEKGWK